MTQDSRVQFEKWYVKEYPDWLRTKEEFDNLKKMFETWQASERRIIDELQSEEMVEVVKNASYETCSKFYSGKFENALAVHEAIAQAAITTITNKLGAS